MSSVLSPSVTLPSVVSLLLLSVVDVFVPNGPPLLWSDLPFPKHSLWMSCVSDEHTSVTTHDSSRLRFESPRSKTNVWNY